MILNKSITPSEDEVSIKSYLCTSFNSIIFGIKADGYLEITNKRLIFQAKGTGISKNSSIIHSEVPISEVVGINIYKGKGFNLLRLLAGIGIIFFINALFLVIVGIFPQALENNPNVFKTILWIGAAGFMYLAYIQFNIANTMENNDDMNVRDNSLKELLLTAIALFFLEGLAALSVNSYNESTLGKLAWPIYFIIFIIALYRFSRRLSFSLFIHSKSGTNSIVRISGPSPMGAANSMASRALTAKPGIDSLLVLNELGAVILDIQNMGNDAISKWQKKN